MNGALDMTFIGGADPAYSEMPDLPLPIVALTAALGQSDQVKMLRVAAHRFMLMAIANWIYGTFFSLHR